MTTTDIREICIKIITGSEELNLSNYSLKLYIGNLRLHYKLGALKLEEAVDKLINFCKKFQHQFKNDIQKILQGYEIEKLLNNY